ncbi:hypothetical protein [Nodosilinea sp. P-1105]|uniref:hypothetical protein n=1 Tax=Nodosilinea sp. P-1105 TaxID=2546229 RepID=UPI00146F742F|nr:hypothetical protein [Nodosilinea sp. P-1105]NMF86644.1 hypothetical protein [Nodosilinea sp. P-1105]
MYQPNPGDLKVSTQFRLPTYQPVGFTGPEGHRLCHILLGDYAAVVAAINRMEVLHYCVGEACPEGKRIAWLDPIPTGRNGEYISVMSHRITPQE